MNPPAPPAPPALNLTRREAMIKMAMLMGATVVGPRLFAASLNGVIATDATQEFSAEELALLDEIGDTIIPATDLLGAKAVGIGAFIAMMVRDCYNPRDQAAFKEGLRKIESSYAARFGGPFMKGNAADRTTLLNELDQEQRLYTAQYRKAIVSTPEKEEMPHYFRMMKELTVLGYFSSEIGCTQALRFAEVPGHFDGGAPYKPGDHGWFS